MNGVVHYYEINFFYIELMNPYTDDDALNFLECPQGVICLVNWFIVRMTMEQYLTILKIFLVPTAYRLIIFFQGNIIYVLAI